MKVIKIGDYIKKQRMELKLTQEELCEGICTAATLSRLENNQQTPTRNRINALLQRMGLPDDRFFALLSENEEQIEALQKEINADQISFRRAGKEERFKIREEALKKLAELESIIEEDDQITQQYILGVKATLGGPDGAYCFEDRLEILMRAIRLTVPRFDLEKIYLNRYNMAETMLINQIAITYKTAGQKRKAIGICSQLLEYIETNDYKLPGYAGRFCLVAHNYAIALAQEKRYEESIELAERGRQTCAKSGNYQFLPGFLAILAGCYYFMGRREESLKYYIQAYYLYMSVGDEDNLEVIKNEMIERHNFIPPI